MSISIIRSQEPLWAVSLVQDYTLGTGLAETDYPAGPNGWIKQTRRVTYLAEGHETGSPVVQALRLGQIMALDCGSTPSITSYINSVRRAIDTGLRIELNEDNLAHAEACLRWWFTPNTLHLEVFWPDRPAISFLVLPNVCVNPMHSSDSDSPANTQRMAARYVSAPIAQVVWTVAVTQRASNSHALRIIREHNASSPTMAIITHSPGEGLRTHDDLPSGRYWGIGYGCHVISGRPFTPPTGLGTRISGITVEDLVQILSEQAAQAGPAALQS